MKNKWFISVIYFITAFFIAFVIFANYIPVKYTLLALLLIPVIMIAEVVFFLKRLFDWAADGAKLNLEIYDYHNRGFKIFSDYLNWQSEKIIRLYEIIQSNPEVLKNLKEQSPSFSLEAVKESSRALEEVKKLNEKTTGFENKLTDMEKRFSDRHIAKYSIYIGVSVGVALFVLGIIFLRIPLPK